MTPAQFNAFGGTKCRAKAAAESAKKTKTVKKAPKLVIVESPAKAKTIAKYLGKGYKVEASDGHVRDLPKSQIGVDVENGFEPKYITIRGRGEIIDRLKREAKSASAVYLATDPDREGEAISWHLAHLLKIDETSLCRIEFNEITKDAIKRAIKSPRAIDLDLVDAQQARRLLDRLVGYQISPILWRKVHKGLSAGRVQSVATRIVCDREAEIQAFVPEEYWTLEAQIACDDPKAELTVQYVGAKDEKNANLKNEEEVKRVVACVEKTPFVIDKIEKSEKRTRPSAPFTTSSLQQEASRRYGFSTKRTMVLAQQLYEGVEVKGMGPVGLITYIRTDSVRIADEAREAAKQVILTEYGPEYYPETPNIYKGKNGAQDAHEAIRPTTLDLSPQRLKASLSRDQYRLYTLVYNRFLASQMTPAVYEVCAAKIESGEYRFRASASRLVFAGYRKVYLDKEEKSGKRTRQSLTNIWPRGCGCTPCPVRRRSTSPSRPRVIPKRCSCARWKNRGSAARALTRRSSRRSSTRVTFAARDAFSAHHGARADRHGSYERVFHGHRRLRRVYRRHGKEARQRRVRPERLAQHPRGFLRPV